MCMSLWAVSSEGSTEENEKTFRIEDHKLDFHNISTVKQIIFEMTEPKVHLTMINGGQCMIMCKKIITFVGSMYPLFFLNV